MKNKKMCKWYFSSHNKYICKAKLFSTLIEFIHKYNKVNIWLSIGKRKQSLTCNWYFIGSVNIKKEATFLTSPKFHCKHFATYLGISNEVQAVAVLVLPM